MKHNPSTNGEANAPHPRNALERRDFLKTIGLGSAVLAYAPWRAMAGPFDPKEFEKLVPADKKLAPEWVKSLFERGTRTVYRGAELEKIGMPVGGICAGQLYLGGDGKLWHWDIFNKHIGTGDSHYRNPLKPSSPLDQGFALLVSAGGKSQLRPLDGTGWSDVSFTGEYPIGYVEYRDPESPASVSLEAFSPFIPLNPEDSNLPATVMRFTVKNTSAQPLEAELAGWLENAVCLYSSETRDIVRRNRVVKRDQYVFLEASAEAAPMEKSAPKRPEIVFDDFERETYESWIATGTAFGTGPVEKSKVPGYQGELGMHGTHVVNSHAAAPGNNTGGKDGATGTLTSKPFTIERHYITFLVGGGSHKGKTCVNLLVDDKVVLSTTGASDNKMSPASWNVRKWEGKVAKIQLVDNETGAWGNIGIDYIVFTDQSGEAAGTLAEESDFGTMGLALLDPKPDDLAVTSLPETPVPSGLFSKSAIVSDALASKPAGHKLVGSLTRKLSLAPGQSGTVTFLVTWHFPNDKIKGLKATPVRHYAVRFNSAVAVVEYLARNLELLASQTRLWHDTWYDSTLPYWFLDRTFLNTSILATSTSHWFQDNRFYGWEGVGCCPGTCTHVWHYAHAMGRLFPQLERSLRELTDYGTGFEEETGRIRFRAEHNNHWAVDGQSGTILRVYREHQASADNQFLKKIWPRVKKSLEFMISKDEGGDGIMDGPQHNTLDADWWGQVAWLSGLYLAALRAGEEMAKELGDEAFARQCREIFEKGRRNIGEKLFNGEYFVQQGDPAHAKSVGSYDGCEIDQVFGQSWAWQVHLGRILDEDKVKTALRSLWRYNFTPDVGPYREAYKSGRWYAMPGEAGLLMCSWPKGEAARVKVSYDYYFNECMNGFEYQVAGHMIWEGMVQEGLAITRAVHDRYHASRRNPWNEVECGDHYARSMASYGVYLAACGYEYHGPQGRLGFAPRLTPEKFQAAFTAAEGWGTFTQWLENGTAMARVALKWGQLRVRTLALGLPPNTAAAKVKIIVAGKTIQGTLAKQGDRVEIQLNADVLLKAGETLEVMVS
ncbi:MAG: GH116 family glycosyl hydrolase [Verrucomicrobiota bacterium]